MGTFLRRIRPVAAYNLYSVEADPEHCAGMQEVMRLNNITYHHRCGFAAQKDIKAWTDTVDHVDLLDFDIQGAEGDIIPDLMDVWNKKAYRLIIATHGQSIHIDIKKV